MKKGFTLIELMTAVSIFAVVVTVSLGSILGIFEANRKTRTLRAAVTNLNLALESMSKEMRFGTNYRCGKSDTGAPENCPSGSNIINFISNEGEWITYDYSPQGGGSILRRVGNEDLIAVTAPEVYIDELRFFTVGAPAGDSLQPKTLIKIKAHAGEGKTRSDLTLQTLVSQRLPE